MKEEAMEHGTKQDAEDMFQSVFAGLVANALEAEEKARFKLMADLGIDKADE